MIVTEKEAAGKICCGAPGNGTVLAGILLALRAISRQEKVGDVKVESFCAGSKCMAWQWSAQGDNDGVRKGYCGLVASHD